MNNIVQHIITVPSNLGNPSQPGTERAPDRLLAALRCPTTPVAIPVPPLAPPYTTQRCLDHMQPVHAHLAQAVAAALATPPVLILGGDHSISMGTLAGYAQPPFVLWIDAHADIHSPATSTSGNVHGMPVHFLLRDGLIDPAKFAYLGTTRVDVAERPAYHRLPGMMADHVYAYGIDACLDSLFARMSDDDALHISLDIDAFDPTLAPGVNTPHGRLALADGLAIMQRCRTRGFTSIELVEINPNRDSANHTIELAVTLLTALSAD